MKKCNHEWKENKTEYYFTWWGDKIKKVTYKCNCCNKKAVKKYW